MKECAFLARVSSIRILRVRVRFRGLSFRELFHARVRAKQRLRFLDVMCNYVQEMLRFVSRFVWESSPHRRQEGCMVSIRIMY